MYHEIIRLNRFLLLMGVGILSYLLYIAPILITCTIIAFMLILSGFQGIYDVDHFIKALRYDIRIVESIPEVRKDGKTKKIKGYQVNLVLLMSS